MNTLVVPVSYQTPLVRPKRGNTPGPEYASALWRYEVEHARRMAYSNMREHVRDNDDVVVDVGGTGRAMVYQQHQVARRLDFDGDDDEYNNYEEEYDYVGSDDYNIYDNDSDDEYDNKNGDDDVEKPMNHRVQSMTVEDLQRPMEQDCPVCLEELKRVDSVTTNCNHSFCVTCYEKYTKRSCPCCRQRVDMLTTYCMMSLNK
jgi:hypothetical protein